MTSWVVVGGFVIPSFGAASERLSTGRKHARRSSRAAPGADGGTLFKLEQSSVEALDHVPDAGTKIVPPAGPSDRTTRK